MSNVGKVIGAGAIFVAGYLVGFYEMKYKTMKCLLKVASEETKKDEAQA